ncbi:hypothetical protein cypCar_00011937 [Cyprinus carpio]|nr:hypothetical protein cypCar_00011937 [Cyprinus carpio]
MDPKHSQILQRHRHDIVTTLNPADICDGFLSKGVFTQDMIDEIQSKITRRDQARQLVISLETRGSQAFLAFLECLRETGQHDLAELLQCGDGARPLIPLPIPSETKGVRPTRPSIQCYKMDASPCGICLIINNVDFDPSFDLKDRKGSNIDCDKMEKRFKALNFEVIVKRNLKYNASQNNFPGAVYGVDGASVPVQLITNYLNGQNCPSLQGKPKLFFIQACGGGEKDTGFEVSSDEVEPSLSGTDDQMDAIPISSSSDSLSTYDETDARATLPTPSDILVSYSTFPGYVSWRHTQAGSWYVENLDRVLEKNAATDDLVTMLTMVHFCLVKLLKTTDRYNKYVLKNGRKRNQIKPNSIIMLPIRVELCDATYHIKQ